MAGVKCRLISRFLLEYVDEELSERPRAKVESHLGRCEHCRRLVSQLRSEAAVARLIQPVAPPENFTARVIGRLEVMEASRPVRPTGRPLSLAWAGWTAAAFALLVLALGHLANLPGTRSVPRSGFSVQRSAPALSGAEGSSVQRVEAPAVAEQPGRAAPEQAAKSGAAEEGVIAEATADELLETAASAEESGQLEEALADYQAAAEEPEVRQAALFGAGRVYEKMGMAVAAIQAFDEALASEEESSPQRSDEG